MPRRRLASSIATLVALSAAGGLCWLGADRAAGFIEQRSRQDVEKALAASGQLWASVATDGLEVRLSGTAPSELDRFRAVTQAGSAVDPSRVVDRMTVASARDMPPPDFKVELLRNDAGISLIGLVPAATDRAALVRTLRGQTAAPDVADLLETADHAVPEGWTAALGFGLRAAQLAPRAKISVLPGHVAVSAVTDSAGEKDRLEADLRHALPPGVRLAAEISAPRPVIAPFALRFVIDDGGARLESCAAETAEDRDRIAAAATRAGADGPACTLGLGAPSPDWPEAAVAAIGAAAALGRGAATLSDAVVTLSAPAGVAQADFDRAVAGLRQALPQDFALRSEREPAPAAAPQGPVRFTATLSEAQVLEMRGRIGDDRMGEAVDSVARARFPAVRADLVNDPAVPGGWTVRVIAALEALDILQTGSVEVTPHLIRLTGTAGDPAAPEAAASLLAERLGPGAAFEMAIRYDRRLDPALALPDGHDCVRRLNIAMSESEIGFEPSKAAIAGDPAPTLDRLAAIMADCADFPIEAGGHTDSQGSEGFNAELSRGRAQALVAAMGDGGIDIANITARGYGESQPIASNETEEGREENRRIEFRLLSENPLARAPLPPPVTLSGVTAEPPPPDQPPPDQPSPDQPSPDQPSPDQPLSGQPLPAPAGPMPPQPEIPSGPLLPQAGIGPVPPAVVGASEVFRTLEEREQDLRLPVRTPDPDTPRPEPRPAEENAR